MDDRFTHYAPERDIYRLLQVDPASDTETIVAACRRLALQYHPDHNRSPRATEEMQVVNSVRRLMTDPVARARYDRARERWIAAERSHSAVRRSRARPSARAGTDAVVEVRTAAASAVSANGAQERSFSRAAAAPPPTLAGAGVRSPSTPTPSADRRGVAPPPAHDRRAREPARGSARNAREARPSRVAITARALAVGVRAGLVALAPTRCERCRATIGSRDRYCDACGTPLLTTSEESRQA